MLGYGSPPKQVESLVQTLRMIGHIYKDRQTCTFHHCMRNINSEYTRWVLQNGKITQEQSKRAIQQTAVPIEQKCAYVAVNDPKRASFWARSVGAPN